MARGGQPLSANQNGINIIHESWMFQETVDWERLRPSPFWLYTKSSQFCAFFFFFLPFFF